MKHGSLFSGIGGFDLAAEWAGWENVFHCEWNPFGQKVLKHYWPQAQSFNDITKTDFTPYANKIDILTGGFPCQPYSSAGKRKGKEDERHLWPEMLRAIREIRPRWIVGENVLGLVNWSRGLVFHEVQADLEAEGYEVQPFLLPAASVGAPHRRDRIFFVAYSNRNGQHQCNGNNEINTSQGGEYALGDAEQSNVNGNVADTNSKRFQSSTKSGEIRSEERTLERKGNQSANESTTSLNQRITTNTTSTGRGQNNRVGKSRFYDQKGSTNNWDNFPTQSPICGGDDGLPTELDGITFSKWRNESIKGYGNAIVPQVVYQIFKAINQYESAPL